MCVNLGRSKSTRPTRGRFAPGIRFRVVDMTWGWTWLGFLMLLISDVKEGGPGERGGGVETVIAS